MLYRSSSMKNMQTLVDVSAHLPAGWKLEAVDVAKADSTAELFRRDSGMVWTIADDSVIYNRATVTSLLLSSLRQQSPVFGFSGSFVKAGALLGLAANPTLPGGYAASLVADRLGISLPADVVDQACIIGAH